MPAPDPFEAAADAVITGDEAALKALLAAHPDLARAHSRREHRATLLHYVAANGVEDERQMTPPNAVAIARLLCDAGADANATMFAYGAECAPLGLLVSSVHPHRRGLQGALAEVLLDHGAEMKGERNASAAVTALAFGYADTAEILVRRGVVINLQTAAGLGLIDDFDRLLPAATPEARHQALALAAIHGRTAILVRLLAAGEDPNRLNPERFHDHSMPLHQAVWAGHLDVVRVLIEHGARSDIRDTMWQGTPLGWAEHGGQLAIAQYLRQAAPYS
ncbi:MAG: ankyrin repeat domain-containing protein [Asticcacaulis sp.]